VGDYTVNFRKYSVMGNITSFKKGNTAAKGKIGKTYPNPLKTKIKEVVNGYINSETFEKDLKKMEPVERFKAYASIIPYVLPRRQQISISEMQEDFADELLNEILNNGKE
jgi:hypothetical protein